MSGIVYRNNNGIVSLTGTEYTTPDAGSARLVLKTGQDSNATVKLGLTTDVTASGYSPAISLAGTKCYIGRKFSTTMTSAGTFTYSTTYGTRSSEYTSNTGYLTRSSTSSTTYATRSSTSSTTYATRSSTYTTTYGTRSSTYETTYGTTASTYDTTYATRSSTYDTTYATRSSTYDTTYATRAYTYTTTYATRESTYGVSYGTQPVTYSTTYDWAIYETSSMAPYQLTHSAYMYDVTLRSTSSYYQNVIYSGSTAVAGVPWYYTRTSTKAVIFSVTNTIMRYYTSSDYEIRTNSGLEEETTSGTWASTMWYHPISIYTIRLGYDTSVTRGYASWGKGASSVASGKKTTIARSQSITIVMWSSLYTNTATYGDPNHNSWFYDDFPGYYYSDESKTMTLLGSATYEELTSTVSYYTTSSCYSTRYLTSAYTYTTIYLTRSSTYDTGYLTAASTYDTGYLTTASTYDTGYLTTASTYDTGYKTRSSTSATGYLTRSSTSATGYLTRSSTSNTGYETRSSTSATGYLTRSSTYSTTYGTASRSSTSQTGYLTTTSEGTTSTSSHNYNI